MGTLTYDSALTVSFDDRLLLHLQIVIGTKLRVDESFMFSWSKPDSTGGRTSVWIDRHIPLVFDYDADAVPTVNRQWLEDLMKATHRSSGLQVIPEPGVPATPRPSLQRTP